MSSAQKKALAGRKVDALLIKGQAAAKNLAAAARLAGLNSLDVQIRRPGLATNPQHRRNPLPRGGIPPRWHAELMHDGHGMPPSAEKDQAPHPKAKITFRH